MKIDVLPAKLEVTRDDDNKVQSAVLKIGGQFAAPFKYVAWEVTLDDLAHLQPVEPKHGEWIPITYRPMDEEEYEEFRKEFGEIPVEGRKMFSCHMPDDDQEILICTSWGGVSQDRCEIDEYGYALETQGDWDGVIAWMPLPEPYRKEGDEEWKKDV